MLLSKDHLKELIALQELDKGLDGLKSEMEQIPVEIAAVRAKLDGEKANLSGAKTAVIDLEKKKKEKELELAQKDEAAQKHSKDLNAVKTNDAFKALQHEIEKAKAEGNQIETEILEIMEKIDEARRQEKAAVAQISGVEKALNAEISALEAKLSETKSRFDAAKGVRDTASAGVDPEILRLYNHIRSRGKLNAVVPLEGDHCAACRISLAPQVIINLTKARELVSCESCQRILYRPESLVAKAV